MDSSSDAVKAWYSDPAHFVNTDVDSKLYDWHLMGRLEYSALFNDKAVLNLGPSGWDEMLFAARSARWVGLDFAEPLVEHLKTLRFNGWEKCDWVVGDFRDLVRFKSAEFDTVLDFSSGDHIEFGRDKMRREVARVLRPGGYYVVTYPNACFINHEEFTREFGYEKRFIPKEMVVEITAAGFVVIQHYFTTIRSGLIAWKEPKE